MSVPTLCVAARERAELVIAQNGAMLSAIEQAAARITAGDLSRDDLVATAAELVECGRNLASAARQAVAGIADSPEIVERALAGSAADRATLLETEAMSLAASSLILKVQARLQTAMLLAAAQLEAAGLQPAPDPNGEGDSSIRP